MLTGVIIILRKLMQKGFELKTPKGTKDFGPYEMAIREKVFNPIIGIFKRHGAVTIDTPVFELKEVLTGKYGEDSKLIYDLQDQGGELCSLRYDLTVPFARYLAMNKNIGSMKRYQIAKVYRRDQPVLSKGRYREFYQCDFDIAGSHYESMVPDAEVFKVIYDGLTAVLGSNEDFLIRCNNRKILDGIFTIAGVEEKALRSVCSAVDKLDKLSWEEVRREMIVEKGISEESANVIGEYVSKKGSAELIAELLGSPLAANEKAAEGLREMQTLFKYFDIYKISDRIQFDLSLARGLDYYTGAILEAVYVKGGEVGSIAGGGRYDNLVGMFSKSGQQIPCVGASIGVERIFTILEDRYKQQPLKSNPTQVFVASAGGDLLEERMSVLGRLWSAGISAEMLPKRKVRTLDQFSYCESNFIPLAVILGPSEMEQGICKVRVIATREESVVPLSNLESFIKSLL